MIEIDLIWEVLNVQLRGLMMSLASNKKGNKIQKKRNYQKKLKY